mgnify:CR=1 FL=1
MILQYHTYIARYRQNKRFDNLNIIRRPNYNVKFANIKTEKNSRDKNQKSKNIRVSI